MSGTSVVIFSPPLVGAYLIPECDGLFRIFSLEYLLVNEQEIKAEIFDVFLCHNSEDKPAVREIAQKLTQEKIKP